MALKVVTWNINGLNNPVKRKRIAMHINKMKAGIVLLQETHLKAQEAPALKLPRFSQQFLAAGSSKARGVAVLLADSLRFQCSDILRDPQGRFIFLKGLLEGQRCTIGAVYAPNTDQFKFLSEVFLQLATFQEGHLIVGGDLNCIAHTRLDV